MSLQSELLTTAKQAQKAARFLSVVSTEEKNKAIKTMAKELLKHSKAIIAANKLDVQSAKKEKRNSAFIDRLSLDLSGIKKMSDDLIAVADLADPVSEVIKTWQRPNGLVLSKVRVPLGVIGIIYESRPNVTSDCAGLCLKTGNAVILRGGKESIHSNQAIYKVISLALRKTGFPQGCISLIQTTDRQAVNELLKLNDYIDLIIPRGGESLIRGVVENSLIPVIKHYKGICHIYVDKYADFAMAQAVAFNAKVQRPSTCNAMECLLVHADIALDFLPEMVKHLRKSGVEIRGCAKTAKLIPGIKLASNQDYATEYLDLILSVKIVSSLKQAVDHIAKYGSKHSEAIITENLRNGTSFLKSVDAACVYLNASTRFTDGNQFGLGAEIGVSTDKLHARGPMGLVELTTYKYVIIGNGQIRT
ncbi:MAG: glutamate-5-semialdehyde dehydrogenase [Candidatus Omnitrophica bacterium]|nr:glutamate-5-semialdehyde dehydrogenase [Candidatus Omnitrophota bacterium]